MSPPNLPHDHTAAATSPPEVPWQRLHVRVIWVDALRSLLSLAPLAVSVWVFGADPAAGGLWPLIGLGAVGVLGAVGDAWRWTFTRYRITHEHVERRTGLFVRSHRSVRRDRIRSVDVHAKLRHRLAGLRVVEIGAGQQTSAGEAALALDAVLATEARALHRTLLGATDDTSTAGEPRPEVPADVTPAGTDDGEVLARFHPAWVVQNLFSVWAYLVAMGVLWGGYWIGLTVGLDLAGTVRGLVDWDAAGRGWTIAAGVAAVSVVGVIGMAVSFFSTHWGFELARVPGPEGTQLRTRQGLFTTREVDRDERRLRGVQIAEPVLWRWLGVADTTVITTGLNVWSMAQPTAILPRGPVTVARPVAAAVLAADPDPVAAPLRRHPPAALRRRMWWATWVTVAVTALLAWLAATDVVAAAWVWLGPATWPVTLATSVVAYRALGHAICGDHLVVRSGLVSRATSVLERSAVSTIAVRESLLQRRLGLRTVSAMTSAGYGVYEAPDLDAADAIGFAVDAAPGALAPFLAANTGGEEHGDGHASVGDRTAAHQSAPGYVSEPTTAGQHERGTSR